MKPELLGPSAPAATRAHRLPDVRRGRPITFTVDGETMHAYDGESIADALSAGGRRVLRRTPRGQAPRGLFCGMGVCFECVVEVSGGNRIRSCMTRVEDGMAISTPSS